MNVLVLIICISIISSKLSKEQKKSENFKLFKGICIAAFLIAIFTPIPIGLLAIIGMILYLSKRNSGTQKNTQQGQSTSYDAKTQQQGVYSMSGSQSAQRTQGMASNQPMYGTYTANKYTTPQTGKMTRKQRRAQKKADAAMGYTTLPKAVSKRRKIIERFNERFTLALTDEQISSIVNASYMTPIWRSEIEAMSEKYETVYEWFTGDTSWLRVYMYVFHIQEISSDIMQQERICMHAFEEIFQFADSLGNLSVSEKISRINHKYLSNFDDVTYMIAYRFMEKKGIRHSMDNQDLVQNETEIDELLKKYRTTPSPSTAQR